LKIKSQTVIFVLFLECKRCPLAQVWIL
jgi:hypothetical protein